MLDSIFGLPLHPLLVHATVVVVPAAALAVALSALWPRFRAWAGWLPLALSLGAVVLTPLSTSSGESLQKRVGDSTLIDEHSRLADLLIWWVVPLAVVAAALWFLHRRGTTSALTRVVLPVLAVVVGIGTLVQVGLIGHSGATSVWKGGSSTAGELTSQVVSVHTR